MSGPRFPVTAALAWGETCGREGAASTLPWVSEVGGPLGQPGFSGGLGCPPASGSPKGAAERSLHRQWDRGASSPSRGQGWRRKNLLLGPELCPALLPLGSRAAPAPHPRIRRGEAGSCWPKTCPSGRGVCGRCCTDRSWSSPVEYPVVLGSFCSQSGYFSFFQIRELISKKLEMSMADINQKWPEDEHYPE